MVPVQISVVPVLVAEVLVLVAEVEVEVPEAELLRTTLRGRACMLLPISCRFFGKSSSRRRARKHLPAPAVALVRRRSRSHLTARFILQIPCRLPGERRVLLLLHPCGVLAVRSFSTAASAAGESRCFHATSKIPSCHMC